MENYTSFACQDTSSLVAKFFMTADDDNSRTVHEVEFTRCRVDIAAHSVDSSRHRCEDMDDVVGGIARGFKLLEQCPVRDAYDPQANLLLMLGILSGTQFMTGFESTR